jgi:hypothetical protein
VTAAVKLALENELRRGEEGSPLRQRLRALQDRVLARPATGEAEGTATRRLAGAGRRALQLHGPTCVVVTSALPFAWFWMLKLPLA